MRPIDADALIEFCAERWIPLNIDAVNMQPTIQPEKAQLFSEGTTKDTISRQAALDALRKCQTYLYDARDPELKIELSSAEAAINNLPTIQPEPSHTQKSCEYCHEDSDGYTRPIEKNCHAYIRFGMNGWELDLKAKGWHGEAQIKFCPMCGRRLING